jgi:hypothetical protein
MREWTLTLPRQLPLWEMEFRWTLKTSESDCRGQNPMACDVLYIIRKILKRRCLKWAHITHLDIWNVSYGQKKGQESNYQFDSRPQKVGNRPDLLSCKGRATYRWKDLDKGYNFALNRTSIGGSSQSYGAPKSRESQLAGFRDSHSRVPREKNHLDVGSVASHRVYYKGEGGGFP